MTKMKSLLIILAGFLAIFLCSNALKNDNNYQDQVCTYSKDSMRLVMRQERKVKPENVQLLKKSFDACKAEVLKKEPGCIDYSLFQSYNDSTLFLLNESWVSREALNAHMKFEHTQKHIAETKGIYDPAFRSKTNYNFLICPGANARP